MIKVSVIFTTFLHRYLIVNKIYNRLPDTDDKDNKFLMLYHTAITVCHNFDNGRRGKNNEMLNLTQCLQMTACLL